MPRIAIAALAIALTAPAAFASQPVSGIAIEVTDADLNDAGRLAQIETRIGEAAEQVCREQVISDLLRAYTLRDCIKATTEHAMAQLDARRGVTTLAAAENQVASSEH
ncbi:MAG: UrcA family protein [Pseudomonadota bacterium]|nr:UrcA family protein [Pseudomonadota bacterium]